MKRAWKPLATLLVLAGAGALLVWAFIEGRAEFALEQERERPVQSPLRVTTTGGESVVTLSPEELTRAGIVVVPAKTIAYPNARTVAGTVIDTEALLALQRHFEAARDRMRELPQARPTALAVLGDGVRRRWGGIMARWLLEQAPPWRRLLQGQDRLVRVVLAPGVAPPPQAWLQAATGQRVALTFVASLPEEQGEEGAPALYLVSADAAKLHGANSVSVALASGTAERGTSLPASAIVWSEGKAWVYVQQAPGRFVRRAVTARPGRGDELIATGLAAGAPVVTGGAQLLLSEEQRAQIEAGEEGE